MARLPMGPKALKLCLGKEKADASSLASCDKSMRVVAQNFARRNELSKPFQKLQQQRMAIDFFNRVEKRDMPEGVAFHARMMSSMAEVGRGATDPSGAPHADAAARGSPAAGGGASPIGEAAAAADADEGDADVDKIAPVCAPQVGGGREAHSAANQARSVRSMETKLARASDALRAAASVGLTVPSTADGMDRDSSSHSDRDKEEEESQRTSHHPEGPLTSRT